jgi:hypothetical protein
VFTSKGCRLRNDADSATSLLSEMRLTGDGKFGVA